MFVGYGIGDPILYWILRISLLMILIYSGWGISYDNPKKFKKYAYIATIFYSVIQGLRWLRGADYPHYYNDLVTLFGLYEGGIGYTITPEPEFLYRMFVTIFYYSKLPFWFAFIFYSALLIWPFLLILKRKPKSAIWALPLFFILTPSAENLIRQYIAEAFLLYSYYFYLCDNKKGVFISLLCIPFIHFSGIIAVAAFIFLYFIQKFIINIFKNKYVLYLLLGIFIYTFYFWDSSNLSTFADHLSYLNADGYKGSGYIESADRWVTSEGSISNILGEKKKISTINSLLTFLTYITIILLGYNNIKNDKRLFIPFCLTYFAIIIKNIGGDIELFSRFYNWFVIFIPLVIGSYLSTMFFKLPIKISLYTLYILFFLYISFFSALLSTSMFGYGFVWDR